MTTRATTATISRRRESLRFYYYSQKYRARDKSGVLRAPFSFIRFPASWGPGRWGKLQLAPDYY